jgi:alpha-mannosidase
VPPLSVAVFDRTALRPAGPLAVEARRLENEHLRVEIGEDGAVARLVHKASGRDALEGAGNQLWVYPADKPRDWDAWEIDSDYAERGVRLDRPESIAVVENGPHRAALRVVHRRRASTIVQTYVLTANGRRLDVETAIDWHDRRAMLRSLTPAAVRARNAVFECAFGVIERPTHVNTSWETARFEAAAHRFVAIGEPDFGLALLNDAKYGHSARGSTLGISLVRGPVYPDPLADEGLQRFTYALMPYGGGWHEGGVREEAEALNQPLPALTASGLAAGSVTALTVGGTPVALSAIKRAEEGEGLILRVYEPAGRRGPLAVAPRVGWTVAGAETLVEEPSERPADAGILPFELRSFRLVRG